MGSWASLGGGADLHLDLRSSGKGVRAVERAGGRVLEDDYDGEFRYDRQGRPYILVALFRIASDQGSRVA